MVWPINRARRFPRTTSRAIDARASRRSHWFRPALERLEDRTVPSFAIRATEFDSLGNVEASSTQTSPLGPGNTFNPSFTLPDFVIVAVLNISTTSPGAAHSTTVNIFYTGPTGSASD